MRALTFLLILAVPFAAQGAEPDARLTLSESVSKALATSPRLSAVRSEQEAASHRADSQFGLFFPKLSLEVTGRYVTEVPTLDVMPGRSIAFGDNEAYSAGPALTWTLWDSGGIRNSWQSSRAVEGQKAQEARNTQKQVELAARQAYFRVLLSSAQLSLVADSLSLAKAQHADVSGKFKVGSASKADALSAHREVLNLETRYLQARSDLAQSLQELFAMTGESGRYELANPVNSRMKAVPFGKPTFVFEVEPLEQAFKSFDEKQLLATEPTPEHPQISAFSRQSEAFREAADAASSGHWPKIQIFAKSSLDYPNGPRLEQVQQNSFGATLSWSLFEGGRVSNEVREKRALAQASDHRKEQAWSDLVRDWRKTRDQVDTLKEQQRIARASAEESDEIARLVYSSYANGRVNFLEVQSANVRALEAAIQAARTDVQLLMQLATLSSLVSEK